MMSFTFEAGGPGRGRWARCFMEMRSATAQACHLNRVAMDITHTEGGIDAATGQIAGALCLSVGDLQEALDDLKKITKEKLRVEIAMDDAEERYENAQQAIERLKRELEQLVTGTR